jgi:hypothetical protein
MKKIDIDKKIEEIMDEFIEVFSDERLVDEYTTLLDNLEAQIDKLATEGPKAIQEVKQTILSAIILPENLKNAFTGNDKVPEHTEAVSKEPETG